MQLKTKSAQYFFTLSLCFFPLFSNFCEEQTKLIDTMKSMKENALQDYSSETESLTIEQIYSILDRGMVLASQMDMIMGLSEGGGAIFPHANISKCGDQIAAVVHASLEACQTTGKIKSC